MSLCLRYRSLCNGRKPAGAVRSLFGGFTLVELVLIMLLVGILAVVALPRFAGKDTFAARGAQSQVLSVMRYAQQQAMVRGPGSNVSFVLVAGQYGVQLNGAWLPNPGGIGFPLTLDSVTTSPASLTRNFDQLGGSSAATLDIIGSQTLRICLESTGYAHAC